MMDSIHQWGPWILGILAVAIGWLLRGRYDADKISQLEDKIKSKDEDLYHLNEAHNLVISDKEKKLASLTDDIALKERVIAELKQRIDQTESSTKTLLSQVVQSKEKKVKQPSIVASISKKAKKERSLRVIPKEKKKQNKEKSSVAAINGTDRHEPKHPLEASHSDTTPQEERNESKKEKKKKEKRIITTLRSENERLSKALHEAETILSTMPQPSPIVKKIIIKKTIDHKKLDKVLKKIPLRKTKKVVRKKVDI